MLPESSAAFDAAPHHVLPFILPGMGALAVRSGRRSQVSVRLTRLFIPLLTDDAQLYPQRDIKIGTLSLAAAAAVQRLGVTIDDQLTVVWSCSLSVPVVPLCLIWPQEIRLFLTKHPSAGAPLTGALSCAPVYSRSTWSRRGRRVWSSTNWSRPTSPHCWWSSTDHL